MRLEPAGLDARRAAGRLRVDHVGRRAHVRARRHGRELAAELLGHVSRERLVRAVGRPAEALEVGPDGLGRARHDARDRAAADEADRVRRAERVGREAEVLERDAARRARPEVRHEAVLLEDAAGLARHRVHHDEDAAARRQAALEVLVERHGGELDRPRRGARDVAALDVAVAGARVRRLVDGDVHRHRHVDLALGELAERVLDRLDRVRDREARHDRVVVEELGRRDARRAVLRDVVGPEVRRLLAERDRVARPHALALEVRERRARDGARRVVALLHEDLRVLGRDLGAEAAVLLQPRHELLGRRLAAAEARDPRRPLDERRGAEANDAVGRRRGCADESRCAAAQAAAAERVESLAESHLLQLCFC
mmetsp:Transcript_13512/g.40260  ORF Transcript_13512/g.40260 Transcript_13512/m.40260 type:complete len:370 (-) Transcript_13512:126-1235(-)